jgi:hypothetical protein
MDYLMGMSYILSILLYNISKFEGVELFSEKIDNH